MVNRMFKISEDRSKKQELRGCVVTTLLELMDENDKVIAMDADLGSASGFTKINKEKPEQFVQCGIAEANMIGVASGMSLLGFKPFVHSFGPFVSRRVFDQLFLSGGYAHTTINVYGSDPGFCAAHNGGTHTTFEDVALIKMIPNALVCDACDGTQMKWIIKNFAQMEGIHYVRGNRKAVRDVYTSDSTFEFGKGNLLKDGKDFLVISAGQLVSDALDVVEELENEGISVGLIDMFTIKPLDQKIILDNIQGKKAVVTYENHSITGGLGSSVAEVLAEHACGIPLVRMGVNEEFGQVGSADWLQKEYKLSKDDLKKTLKDINTRCR